ncbi:MAG: 50S ribosomal protein L3 [Methanobacteriota archaeon]
MAKRHHPKRGSHGYSPRKRAPRPVPRIEAWAPDGDAPRLQGFAGYKAGMTHAMVVDYRPTSTTSGQEVHMPVTVLETPPMRVAAVRFYSRTPYGLKTWGEIWAKELDPLLSERVRLPKKETDAAAAVAKAKEAKGDLDDVRVLAYTQPDRVTGIGQKAPDIMEIRVGGGALEPRIDYAVGLLGKEIDVAEWTQAGAMVDTIAVTKGHGFQGSVPRWGVKQQSHKNSKNRRDTSPLGPWHPNFIRSTVPMPGQTGYHNRTQHNTRVVKVGVDGAEITPAGGFVSYGVVRNKYLLLFGSVPGPARRIIRLRDAVRYTAGVKAEPQIAYISTASKQGA